MGVIDLDARVKKLEEGGGGGADPTVIDQLEAAVTALEETVNGDGETDLGLVGDVAALETATTPVDVSNLFTPNPSLTFRDSSQLIARKIGNIVFMMCVADIASGATSGQLTDLYTLDSSILPAFSVRFFALGPESSAKYVSISQGGVIQCNGGVWQSFAAFWFVS